MPVRLYISPITGDGSPISPYEAKVRGRMWIPTHPQGHADYGKPIFNWALVLATETDWTANDADPENERVFGIDLPDNINTLAELRAYLKSRTLGEIPAARRSAIQTRLTNRGVDITGLTLQSTWWQLLVRIYQHLQSPVPENL